MDEKSPTEMVKNCTFPTLNGSISEILGHKSKTVHSTPNGDQDNFKQKLEIHCDSNEPRIYKGTILNVPKIIRKTREYSYKSVQQMPFIPHNSATGATENKNYLLSIKNRCKKKIGRRDKNLITPNTEPVVSSTPPPTSNSESDNSKLSSNDSSLLDLLDKDSESILKEYLAILYGEEATSLSRNEYDTSVLNLDDSYSKDVRLEHFDNSNRSSLNTTKSLKNKFEYRRDGGEGKPFICGICSKSFGQHSNIVLHMRSHTGEKPYKCDVCSKGFSGKSDLNRHKNIHSVIKKYWCDECKRGFNDNSGFRRHKLIYHSAMSKKCTICPKSYLAQKDLDRHMKTHNKMEKNLFESNTSGSKSPATLVQEKIPDPHINNSIYLEDLVKKELDLEIEDSLQTVSPPPNKTPSTSSPTPESEADKDTTSYSDTETHPAPTVVQDERPHKCEQCSFACSKRSNLRKHIAYVHCLERFYKCDICYKGFKSSWALKRHKQVHSDEKVYQCDVCDKGFNDTGSFKYHMKSHRGERSYHCEVCAKSFILKSDLKKHMSSHIKRLQQAAMEPETNKDMEVLIQSDESFLNLASYM